MKAQLGTLLLLPLGILAVSCGITWPLAAPTPLPGWDRPVGDLFVDESAFPEGWRIGFPGEATPHPTANHVAREWWGPEGSSGVVIQSIWRALTVARAETKYDEVYAESHFQADHPVNPGAIFVPFEPPEEIDFRSQVADEFYLACGWWDVAYCQVVARYRNYVVYMRLEREAACEGHVTHGLTYAEIETVVQAMDAKFAAAMKAWSTPPPW